METVSMAHQNKTAHTKSIPVELSWTNLTEKYLKEEDIPYAISLKNGRRMLEFHVHSHDDLWDMAIEFQKWHPKK